MSESFSDSEEDFDAFSILTDSKPLASLQILTSKRPNLFEDNEGFKKLKAPPKTAPPPFYKKTMIETLKKSEELKKMHDDDERIALDFLSKEDNLRDTLLENLSVEAVSNTEFIDYLISHHKEIKLNDFFYIAKPSYVKLNGLEPDLELGLIGDEIIPNQKGDIYNELDLRKIELLEVEDIVLEEFLERIGISKKNANLEKITQDQITINTYQKLQNPLIILTKFYKLVKHITTKKYNPEAHEKLIRVFSFIIIDKNIFSKSLITEINEILLVLTKWQYDHDDAVDLPKILNIWAEISELPAYTYRIVEMLDPTRSNITRQLKLQLCLNLITEFKDFQYFKDQSELQQLINKSVSTKLDEFIAIKFSEVDDANVDQLIYDLRIKLQALMIIIKHEDLQDQKGKKLTVVKLKRKLIELHDNIHISYQKSEQAALRSVLFLINTKLKTELQST